MSGRAAACIAALFVSTCLRAAEPASPFQVLWVGPPSGVGGYPIQIVEAQPGIFYGISSFANHEVGSSIFSLDPHGTYKTVYRFPPYFQAYSLSIDPGGMLLGDGGLTQGAVRNYEYFTFKDGFTQRHPASATITPGTIAGSSAIGEWYGFVNTGYQTFSLVRVDREGKTATIHAWSTGEGIPYRAETVIQARDGAYYGVAAGSPSGMTKVWLYRIAADGKYTRLAELPEIRDTTRPIAILDTRNDGLYLTIPAGGRNRSGAIIAVGTNGKLRTLAEFPKDGDMAYPAFLMQALDGNIYGTNAGLPSVLFRLDPKSGELKQLYKFDKDGREGTCICRFVEGADGKFYGEATIGGRSGTGVLFRFDPGFTKSRN